MNWVLYFFCLAWISLFTSQSLLDLSDTLIFVGALVVAFRAQEIKAYFQGFKPVWFWPLWLVVGIVGLLVNVGFHDSKPWVEFLEFRWILSFLAIIYLATRRLEMESWFRILAGILAILNIVAFYLFLQDPYWRAGGILREIMPFSQNIAPVFCIYALLVFVGWGDLKKNDRYLYGFVALTSGLLTVLTFTRGVWIGCAVALVVGLYIWNKKKALYMLLTLAVFTSVLILTNERIKERVFSKTTNETQSNSEREALWRGNWAIIKDHPLLGVGFNQNKNYLRHYYDQFGYPPGQRVSHAHNQYLQIWGGTGTLGLLCFLAFCGMILKKVYQSLKELKGFNRALQLSLYAALIEFMVAALTESNFNIAKNRYLFLMIAGIALAVIAQNKKLQTKGNP